MDLREIACDLEDALFGQGTVNVEERLHIIYDAIEDSSERGGWGRAEWQESRQQRAKMFGELLASQKDVQNNPIAAEACKERSK